MSDKTDILVLGATGFTGRLITRYLSTHPQRKEFTLAVAARSDSKLQNVLEELNLDKDSSIRKVRVDVTKEEDVERAVRSTRVVINTVGPYWRWGTPVVKACASNGVHYVDLTGEAVWMKRIIEQFHSVAKSSGAIIVPACGYDSIPSDITAHLANKTLKCLPTPLEIESSYSGHDIMGGVSGGTLSTFMTMFEQVSTKEVIASMLDYSLSPVQGRKYPRPPLWYSIPVPGASTLNGGFFVMAPGNKAVVQRTFGLLEEENNQSQSKQATTTRYGSEFIYDEFLLMPNAFAAAIFSAIFLTGFMMVAAIPPVRWVFKQFIPQPGEGPSEESMKNGHLVCTNITKSTSQPSVYVKTVIKGHGDPGYLLTSIMISESALSLILGPPGFNTGSSNAVIKALPEIGQRGGILTPMSAFGDVLIQRLEATKSFEFTSDVISKTD